MSGVDVMNEKDMMILIGAWESFYKLDQLVKQMTGQTGIDLNKYRPLWQLPDVIKMYSKYRDSEADKDVNEFFRILNDLSNPTEEKYKMLE